VRAHLDRFLRETAATDGVGLPRFVEREFRDFLGCGQLERGFVRVRCDACRFERLVPFSCKARAICPSCGGRRMAEQAARLVDGVLPWVPVRQWVLTVPHRLRYRLALDHALCRAVLGVFVRAVLAWYRRRARRAGIADGRGGTVTVVQRFGSGLELNVHFHVIGSEPVPRGTTPGTRPADHALRLTEGRRAGRRAGQRAGRGEHRKPSLTALSSYLLTPACNAMTPGRPARLGLRSLCLQRHSEWQVHPFDVFFQAWVWIAGVGWFAT
jgi:ribosomal protein S27E